MLKETKKKRGGKIPLIPQFITVILVTYGYIISTISIIFETDMNRYTIKPLTLSDITTYMYQSMFNLTPTFLRVYFNRGNSGIVITIIENI